MDSLWFTIFHVAQSESRRIVEARNKIRTTFCKSESHAYGVACEQWYLASGVPRGADAVAAATMVIVGEGFAV